MSGLVEPRLINPDFGDPGLFLNFRFGREAVLFDIGDLSALTTKEILKVRHIFVSHMHLDHFVGFDRLLRMFLHQRAVVSIHGPPGLCDAIEAKLRGYVWNLLNEKSPEFIIRATDWAPGGAVACSSFSTRKAFRREPLPVAPHPSGTLLDVRQFRVEAVELDHGIPCLAFAFQEGLRLNVHKARLDELGLPVGPWLTEAKRALRAQQAGDTEIDIPGHGRVLLSTLLSHGALVSARGQRIAYATDFAFTEENVEKVAMLARGADHLFIEAVFLEEDRQLANAKHHLTASQAGSIAAAAGVARATPFHFSPRYLGREEALRAEFRSAFALPRTHVASAQADRDNGPVTG